MVVILTPASTFLLFNSIEKQKKKKKNFNKKYIFYPKSNETLNSSHVMRMDSRNPSHTDNGEIYVQFQGVTHSKDFYCVLHALIKTKVKEN